MNVLIKYLVLSIREDSGLPIPMRHQVDKYKSTVLYDLTYLMSAGICATEDVVARLL